MPLVPVDKLRLPNETTLIPRLREDPYLVTEYAAAMRYYGGWGDFPPAVCDQEYLVLGGVTRVLAALEADVDKVKVTIVECESAADRLLVAVADNAVHGKRWSSKDAVNLALLAERMGVTASDVAIALRVRVERVERVPVTTVVRRSNGKSFEEKVYLKRAVRAALRNRVLSEQEEAVMARITTPNSADLLLLDLLRIGSLDALPPLNAESYRSLVAVQQVLTDWLARDAHLLGAA